MVGAAATSPGVSAHPVPRALAAVPSAPPAGAERIGGGPPKHANGGGGLSFKIGGINIARMAVFAGLGAAAAAVIPPLAVLGGPIGGAVVGALLSLVL